MLGSGALAEIAGPLKDFADKIGGEDGERWWAGFKRFLRGEETWPRFLVWKTIKLGTGLKTANDFRKALKDNGFKLSNWADDILRKPSFAAATEETEVDLVKTTVAELGFKSGARRGQIYERAKELGFALCPPEVGPQLRLQYKDQRNGEWVLVGMEPVTDSDGRPDVFDVGRYGSGLWLYGGWSYPGGVWDPGSRWVFVRPRK